MDTPTDDDLVTIDRFIFIAEAVVARATLEAAGIDAVLADENIVRMAWGEAQAHGGVRLQVRRSDAEAAAEVLISAWLRSAMPAIGSFVPIASLA